MNSSVAGLCLVCVSVMWVDETVESSHNALLHRKDITIHIAFAEIDLFRWQYESDCVFSDN